MMKVLILAAMSLAAVIGPANAQVPGAPSPMVPYPQPGPTSVKTFTVKPGDHEKEWTCQEGKSIQSVSAVQWPKDEIVPVVFLSQEKKGSPNDVWIPSGFKFKQDPKEEVRVTMTCDG